MIFFFRKNKRCLSYSLIEGVLAFVKFWLAQPPKENTDLSRSTNRQLSCCCHSRDNGLLMHQQCQRLPNKRRGSVKLEVSKKRFGRFANMPGRIKMYTLKKYLKKSFFYSLHGCVQLMISFLTMFPLSSINRGLEGTFRSFQSSSRRACSHHCLTIDMCFSQNKALRK